MRAVVCEAWGGPESLIVREIASRAPGADEVRIRVRAAAVNFPDLLIIQKKYQVQPALPFVPGAEAAGEVLEAGGNVRHLAAGQRVACYCGVGAFAEEVTVPAAVTLPIPDHLPFETAASLTLAYGTSLHALADRAALREGETLLVLGAAGGVGLAAVEIGKALGARVIACASTEEKLALCRAHGADQAINYVSENLRERIKALTEGMGPHVIYDAVGGAYAEPALRSIAWRGRYLIVGFATGEIPAVPFNLPLLKGASIIGVFWGEFAKREPRANLEGLTQLQRWLAEGKLRPHTGARYSLSEAPLALQDLAARRAMGKLIITP
jgi:NADPH2:quinone reductase